jgi:hypothetical protein
MKGDRVEIVVDAGGEARTYEMVATRAGRRIEVSVVRNVVTVAEVTRGGSVVRNARFMASRVLALVEHPAPRGPQPDDEPASPSPATSHDVLGPPARHPANVGPVGRNDRV